MEILPYLTTAKRGYPCKGDLCEVIQCILYKLKTGCQWHMIPTMAIFTEVVLHYKTIFGKFRQWCKDGSWQKSWESLLGRNRDMIDLSSADLDGSHTVARRGGEEVGGAAHKAAQTTNAIFIADRQGIPMAMQQPYKNDEKYLLDRELLSLRYSIERTNAWMDSFRSVLNRFDKTVSSWKGWNLLAFHVIFLKHIIRLKKSR